MLTVLAPDLALREPDIVGVQQLRPAPNPKHPTGASAIELSASLDELRCAALYREESDGARGCCQLHKYGRIFGTISY